jgi:hypothetical protein
VSERATLAVGADGRHSLLAERVRPDHYRERPPLLADYYIYWSRLPVDGRYETFIRAHRGFAAAPHNGLTAIAGGWPYTDSRPTRESPKAIS